MVRSGFRVVGLSIFGFWIFMVLRLHPRFQEEAGNNYPKQESFLSSRHSKRMVVSNP